MRRIELAYPYTDAAGTRHEADTVVDLDDTAALELVAAGRARHANGDQEVTVQPPATLPAPTSQQTQIF